MSKLTSLAIAITALALAGCSDPVGLDNGLEAGQAQVEQKKPAQPRGVPADTTHRVGIEPER